MNGCDKSCLICEVTRWTVSGLVLTSNFRHLVRVALLLFKKFTFEAMCGTGCSIDNWFIAKLKLRRRISIALHLNTSFRSLFSSLFVAYLTPFH